MGQGRIGRSVGKAGPHTLACGDMRAMQRARLAGIEPFRQVGAVPKDFKSPTSAALRLK